MRTERLTADGDGLARAAAFLRGGALVAIPTETVYGLAADAGDDRAVAGIFAAKDRPRFNPLIAHVDGPEAADRLAVLNDAARALAAAFWPGPLTLVLPRRAGARLSDLVTAGGPSVALRCPAHPVARAVIAAAGRPLAAPSANLSGRVSPTTADHVLTGLSGRIAAVLDGGSCAVGVESTIVSLTDRPRLLRPGGLPAEAIEATLGAPLAGPTDGPLTAPGQLASHYAPLAGLRLDADAARPGERLLGFGGTAGAEIDLSPSGDLTEAAAGLFAALHALDGPAPIAVAPIPETGLGRAINDRLRRAAAPRD